MAHRNQPYWQGVSDQMFADIQQHTLSFKVRVRKIAHRQPQTLVREVLMSNEDMDSFIEWMQAREEGARHG